MNDNIPRYPCERITKYILIGPCDGTPCSGQGTCTLETTDATDGHSCACNAGYSGDECETGKSCSFF